MPFLTGLNTLLLLIILWVTPSGQCLAVYSAVGKEQLATSLPSITCELDRAKFQYLGSSVQVDCTHMSIAAYGFRAFKESVLEVGQKIGVMHRKE